MSLTLTIPDEIAAAAQALAQRSGDSPEEVLLRALRAHFPSIPSELLQEFSEWEMASDEDAVMVERMLAETDGPR